MKVLICIFLTLLFVGALKAKSSEELETRNQKVSVPWKKGIIPDLQAIKEQHLCNKQCGNGGSWTMTLVAERLSFIYDQTSSTLAFVDSYRNMAIVFTKNVNGFALVNLSNGWAMVASLATGYAFVLPSVINSVSDLKSTQAAFQYNILQALSVAIVTAVPQIPTNLNIIYGYGNTLDLRFLIRMIKSRNPYRTMINDGWLKHAAKVLLYRSVIANTSDIFGRLMASFSNAQDNVLDILQAMLDRAPGPIAAGCAKMTTLLVGTSSWLLDSVSLYSQLFGLLSLSQSARTGVVTGVGIGLDRTWIVGTTSLGFLLTSSGKVYYNGQLIDMLDDTQEGTIANVVVSSKATLVTNFGLVKKHTGIIAGLISIPMAIGKFFGVPGLVRPFDNLAKNIFAGGIDVLRNVANGGFGGLLIGDAVDQDFFFGG